MNIVSQLGNFSLDSFKSKVKVSMTSLVAQKVKHLPAMRETWVRSLSREDPLEKEMATPSIPWRRKWQPTPVLLPGKFHGWRSLAGYSSWGCKELDMTQWLHFHLTELIKCLDSIVSSKANRFAFLWKCRSPFEGMGDIWITPYCVTWKYNNHPMA